jgi:sigma-B regulation protein RsbU (phosphoserine phosphatase)
MFLGVIDPGAGKLLFCNAGHNPPLLVRSSGETERLMAVGTALGILPGLSYQEETTDFSSGDLLAIYSDGVTESENPDGEEFGEQRLAELLASMRTDSAGNIVDGVIQAIAEWTAAAPAIDDITLLVARSTR